MTKQKPTILVIEDEERIAHWVQTYLARGNFYALIAHDGRSGLQMARTHNPDLIILDLMLPHLDGETICRTLRDESDVPIIMLTAKDGEQDRVKGLKLGADDYVVKPFSAQELVARVEAVLRRSTGKIQQCIKTEDITLDVQAHRCTVRGEAVALSPTHFSILEALMRHKNQVLSREQLIALAFTDGDDLVDRTIDAHIRRLRIQIERDPKNPSYIQTAYGVGYQFIG